MFKRPVKRHLLEFGVRGVKNHCHWGSHYLNDMTLIPQAQVEIFTKGDHENKPIRLKIVPRKKKPSLTLKSIFCWCYEIFKKIEKLIKSRAQTNTILDLM